MPSEHQSQPPTAGVVGAGIAGLSAAVALRRAGLQVQVYERSRFKNEIGAAITVPPNATVALRRWGFDFEEANAVPNERTRCAAAGDLSVIHESYYQDMEAQMGAPCLSFHRVDLHRGLRSLATEGNEGNSGAPGDGSGGNNTKGIPVSICLGCEVRSVDCENGILTLADGSKVQKDLVIIADGAHSTLLPDFLGRPAPAQHTGRSIYRWLVATEDLMADPEASRPYRDQHEVPGFVSWSDAEKRILWVSYTCQGGALLSNAVVHETEDHSDDQSSSNNTNGPSDHGTPSVGAQPGRDNDDKWHTPASIGAVLNTLCNFHPDLRRIVLLGREDGIRVHRLFKRPPLDSFVRGRTAIIGDAAHLMLPTHAAGCAIAIESASVLEVLFKDLENDPIHSADGYGEEEGTEREDAGWEVLGSWRERVIRGRLRLFDRLRVPRCNLTMLMSNAGPEGLRVPGVEQDIRKYYRGPLPAKHALPWSAECRELLFHYDAFEAAKQALSDEKARNGATHDGRP
ncbi:FAD/NAD(P)-binding domain-containing protein [Xylaria palmicola]|nr:FAD/NAD(P)-binding domain-containing protein [Xylaria palmicola]